MVLTVMIPGLDAHAACVAEKSVHLPHKEGRGRAGEYLERKLPVPCLLRRQRERISVLSRMTTLAEAVAPQIEAVEVFKAFRVAAENESGKRTREIMTDNVRKLSMVP